MATLHGSWLVKGDRHYWFLWSEAWREEKETSAPEIAIPSHPFNLDLPGLKDCLQSSQLWFPKEFASLTSLEILELPSYTNKKLTLPLLAGQKIDDLKPSGLGWQAWQVQGLALKAEEAVLFFQSLPLGIETSRLGSDLQFFAHLYRWTLDLLVRQKFIPSLEEGEFGHYGQWYPLLDSTQDQTRLAKLTQLLPPVCLAYQGTLLDDWEPSHRASDLILSYLQHLMQAQIRHFSPNLPFTKDSLGQLWLQSLTNKTFVLKSEPYAVQKLATAIRNWQLPIQAFIGDYRNQNLSHQSLQVALVLEPPTSAASEESKALWQLNYRLQALDDPNWYIAAETIWQNNQERYVWNERVLEQPQEILLKGLGLASRLYAPIAESLEKPRPIGCPLDAIQVFEFIKASAWQLQDQGLGVIVPPSLTGGVAEKRLGLKIQGQVTPQKGERLTLKSLLQYQLKLVIGDQEISQKDFQALLDQRSPLVEMNGQWITLQPADVRAAQAILNQSQDPLNLSVEDALRLSMGDSQTIAKLPVVKFEASGVLQELIANLNDNQGIQAIPNPPGFQGELRPYQAKGVGWLAFLEKWGLGSCLADDMGLGKTPQLLAFLLNLKAEAMLTKPVLIVCPTSVINNWSHEIKKFAPSLAFHIHHGDKRSKGSDFAKNIEQKQIILTSYSLLFRDIKSLGNIVWQGVVLDEAQNIKNPQSKQSQAVRKLQTGFRIALTGTPVENRLAELWAILDFLNPDFLGTQAFFQRRFATPIEKFGDRQSLQILRSLVRPFILRRLKTDRTIIQDLPEKQEMTIFCGLSSEQANLYQQLVEKSLQDIEESTGIQRRGLILSLLVKLKQICNHPAQFLKESTLTSAQVSGKLLRLEEMLEEVITEGDRALIFTQFAEWGKLLQPYLKTKFKQEVLFLSGATPRLSRQAMIDRFQNDPDAPSIFILSLKAGGTGLNLTRANHVFHCDRWWNPAVENQATDRAFRIGQKRNVQVHKFVCTGTLEERIDEMITSKKQLAEQTVDAGENWLTELDTDQLRNLLLLDRNAIIDES
jgi:hypothetical protein